MVGRSEIFNKTCRRMLEKIRDIYRIYRTKVTRYTFKDFYLGDLELLPNFNIVSSSCVT